MAANDVDAMARADLSPVRGADPSQTKGVPDVGIGLCLSGGGYRAMLFHLGALWRLNSAGLLRKLDRLSSVSGGSITSGVLAMNWSHLAFDPQGVAAAFDDQVTSPVRRLASKTIDEGSIVGGLISPFSRISDEIQGHYRDELFGATSLQDLPDLPRFVFNASNLQSTALWRFSKPYMGDYRVGRITAPDVLLAAAVTASSAFPPFLSPYHLDLTPFAFDPDPKADLQRAPFTLTAVLSDGGVYDNMGLETVWKRFQTVLVSDAGAKMQPEEQPHDDWPRQMYRVLDVIDNQVRSLRARQVVGSFQLPATNPLHRAGALWTIRTDIKEYGLSNALPCDFAKTTALARVPTRLAALPATTQEQLINWGFAITDAALRARYDPTLPAAGAFPYPGGVG
jgi:NTE family protein